MGEFPGINSPVDQDPKSDTRNRQTEPGYLSQLTSFSKNHLTKAARQLLGLEHFSEIMNSPGAPCFPPEEFMRSHYALEGTVQYLLPATGRAVLNRLNVYMFWDNDRSDFWKNVGPWVTPAIAYDMVTAIPLALAYPTISEHTDPLIACASLAAVRGATSFLTHLGGNLLHEGKEALFRHYLK